MAKAFWKGAISFGMVSIPVKMYVATTSHVMNFHLLHKKCLTRPKQVLHCEEDNEYFGIKETVRGYEYGKGQYVVLKDSDFNKVPVRTTHIIDIVGFVKDEEIDPLYFYGSHYLEPEEFAVKPYFQCHKKLRIFLSCRNSAVGKPYYPLSPGSNFLVVGHHYNRLARIVQLIKDL